MKLFRTQKPDNSPAGAKHRSGLSLLEFLGCLIAVVGGAWLGAIYLGINVQSVAYSALEDADLLETLPERWRPNAPNGSDKFRGMSREQLVTSLRQELVALRNEITTLRTNEPRLDGSEPTTEEADNKSVDPQAKVGPSKEKTLAYWNRLSEIALGEAALQRDAELAFTDENAAKVLAIKGRVSRFAGKAVEVIPRDRVDPNTVELGEQLAEWYARGGELYEKAVRIQSFPSENTNRDVLTKEWRREDTQHRNEAQLLSNRAIAVRDEMQRRFEMEFPLFGQPSTDESSSENVPPPAED